MALINENIYKLRTRFHLSQKDFGLIANVSDKAVSAWEAGIREPRMGAIQKIADHFNLLKSDLIDRNVIEALAEKTKARKESRPELSEMEIHLLNGFRQLSPEERAEILYLLDYKVERIRRRQKMVV